MGHHPYTTTLLPDVRQTPVRERKDTMGFLNRGHQVRIILASTHPEAIEALDHLRQNGRSGDERFQLRVEEALTTQGVYTALSRGRFHLVIVDLEALPEAGLPREALESVLTQHRIPHVSGEEFARDPEKWRGKSLLEAGIPQSPPPQVVGLVSYSGGVGKTTVSLHTARCFAQQVHLPVAVLELCHGVSGLACLTQTTPPFLHQCALQGEPPLVWRGITLLPLDYGKAARWEPEAFVPYLKGLASRHILTVVDSRWPHDLLPAVWNLVDRWMILAMANRLDTLANGLRLQEELKEESGLSASVVINRCPRSSGFLLRSVTGIQDALRLGEIASPDDFSGELGEQFLPFIYPDWRKYESSSLHRGLGHLLGRGA